MKKYIIILITMLTAPTMFADNVSVGFNAGAGTGNENAEDGLYIQGYTDININPNVVFRGCIAHFSAPTEVDALSDGTFTMNSLEGSIIVRKSSGVLRPYVGVGVGYYMPANELSDEVDAIFLWLNLRAKESIEDGIGFNVLGGMNINITENIGIDIGAKYVIYQAEAEAELTNLSTFISATNADDITLNTLFVHGGIFVSF